MYTGLLRSSAGQVTGYKHNITLSTIECIPGYRIRKVIGVVRGNTIRARHAGRDLLAALRSIVGGEITEYTKLMGESREQAIDRMVDQAIRQRANAILGIRLTTSTLMGGAAELVAYGTAVILEKEESQ